MLHGASIPLIAKICAAVVVTGGAGVVTYEVAGIGDKEPTTVVAQSSESGEPDALAFADSGLEAEAFGGVAIEGDDSYMSADDVDEKERDEKEHDEKVEDAHEAEVDKKEHDQKVEDEEKDEDEEKEKDEEVVDTEAPEVVILWPEDNAHYDDEWVVFEGEAESGARVFAGPYEADVDDAGNWRIELRLSPGANTAVIHAKDEAGNVGEDSVTVWLDVEETVEEPKDEEHEEEPEDEEELVVEFSANQKYGACEEEVPYDVFWGTATPHTLVTISSPYGSATAEVGKKGHWEKKVWFENAPRGVEFAVTVTAENSSQTFEFIAVEFEEHEGDEGHED